MPGGVFQTTQYVYDALRSAGSDINSKDLLTEIRYPIKSGTGAGDPGTTNADKLRFTYNALGDTKTRTDQNQTTRTFTYDVLGRWTKDEVTTLGAGVDNRVMRQEATYTALGQRLGLTSYDGAVSTVATVGWTYNGFGEQTTETSRSHLTGGYGSVTYSYSFNEATGGANHSRMTGMTYPGGRSISYYYGVTGSLNEKISRVESIREFGTNVLEGYSYLGLGTIIERSRSQPGTVLTYIDQAIGDEPMDAGDQYTGLDRFGRVADQRWRKGATDFDRFIYTYDENSNRTSKDVLGSGNPGNLDESYTYDALDRLTKTNRGSLVSGTITDANATYAQTWTLDSVSNWGTFVTDTNGGAAGGTTTRTKGHDRRNRITSISGQSTPTYDANGNMTGDETGKVFKFDAWDRLVVLDSFGSEQVRYTYDARGYRTERAACRTTGNFYSTARNKTPQFTSDLESFRHHAMSPP